MVWKCLHSQVRFLAKHDMLTQKHTSVPAAYHVLAGQWLLWVGPHSPQEMPAHTQRLGRHLVVTLRHRLEQRGSQRSSMGGKNRGVGHLQRSRQEFERSELELRGGAALVLSQRSWWMDVY